MSTEPDVDVDELIQLFDDGGLSAGEAEAYVYRDVLGKDRHEAAELLDKSPSTVDSLHHRAQKKIETLQEALAIADNRSPDQPFETGFLEEIEIHHHAEDVKVVRFIGFQGTADVKVTDDTMVMFAEAAEEVFDSIHKHMNEIRELFRDYGNGQNEEPDDNLE